MLRFKIRTWLAAIFIPSVIIPVSIAVLETVRAINAYRENAAAGSVKFADRVTAMGIEAVMLLMVAMFLVGLYFFIEKRILKPLSTIKNSFHSIKEGFSYKLDISGSDEIGEVAAAFNEIACALQESYKKLEEQTNELYEKNWELQEANTELEASYGQLQATIEQLNEAEQKYHSLVRSIPEMVCVVDNNGTITFANHVCAEVLGYEKSELVGMNISSIVRSKFSQHILNEIVAKLKTKNSLTIEIPLVKKDGSSIITEANLSNYIVNGVKMGIQAIVRDITQKRRLQEQIIQNNKDLELLNSVSKSMTSTLDLDDLTKLIVRLVTDSLGFSASVLRMLDATGSRLEAKAYSGRYFKGVRDVLEMKHIDMSDEIMGKVVVHNEPRKISDIPDDWIIGRINKLKPEKERIKEILLVPLSVKDKRFGVLSVCSTSNIKPREVSLISAIANNAAVAIDNALMYETSKKYFLRTINALIAAVEAKDSYTEGHSQRVSKYAVKIASKLGLSKEQIEDIRIAGILHDIGKIGISDNILVKPGRLTEAEYQEVKQHPAISNKILYPVGFSDRTLKAIAFHHERFDGKGYPFGLSGDDITLEAQIIAVADAYDAMTSSRPYRKAMKKEEALRELIANKATQFNSAVVDAFVAISDTLDDPF